MLLYSNTGLRNLKRWLFSKRSTLYLIAFILIILLAFFFRFYRFSQRWVLFSDAARDALVAREALEQKRLPLTGSFSSAGPFVFGPLFYWFIMLSFLPNASLIMAPWIMTALISVIVVIIAMRIGCIVAGKPMSLLLGLMTAISPAQVIRAVSLTQHSFISIASILVLWSFTSYLKNEKKIYLFLMGLSLGLGLSMHYQALNLGLFGLAVFLPKKLTFQKIWQGGLLLLSGILIPSLPLLLWDRTQGWANTKNILDYLLIGQYRIWVSNRWLTYIFSFWPKLWSSIIGGQPILGYLLIMLFGLIFLKKLIQKTLSKTVFWMTVIFLIQVFILRYYRGEKFEGYLIYLQPLVLFFSAWALIWFFKFKKNLAILTLILIIGLTALNSFTKISKAKSRGLVNKKVVKFLKEKYPKEKFLFYNHANNDVSYFYSLLILLEGEGLVSENGRPLGVCPKECNEIYPVILDFGELEQSYSLLELDKNYQFKKPTWEKNTQEIIYNEIIFWWKRETFQSPFSLPEFLKGKLKFR